MDRIKSLAVDIGLLRSQVEEMTKITSALPADHVLEGLWNLIIEIEIQLKEQGEVVLRQLGNEPVYGTPE